MDHALTAAARAIAPARRTSPAAAIRREAGIPPASVLIAAEEDQWIWWFSVFAREACGEDAAIPGEMRDVGCTPGCSASILLRRPAPPALREP